MVEDEPFHADVNACCACCSSLIDSCYQGPVGSTQWFCTWTLTEEFAEVFQRLSSAVDVYDSLKRWSSFLWIRDCIHSFLLHILLIFLFMGCKKRHICGNGSWGNIAWISFYLSRWSLCWNMQIFRLLVFYTSQLKARQDTNSALSNMSWHRPGCWNLRGKFDTSSAPIPLVGSQMTYHHFFPSSAVLYGSFIS